MKESKPLSKASLDVWRLLTLNDAVREIRKRGIERITVDVLRWWLKKGAPHYRLPSPKSRGRIYVDLEELEGWMRCNIIDNDEA